MKNWLPVFFLLLCATAQAQTENPTPPPARVIFYNVENLFDTLNDPATNDEEFLPGARNQWNSEKYQVKLQHLASVFGALLDTIQPFIIGLCEIENEKVVYDLLAQPELKKYFLGVVHYPSPDERGIDVALIYNTRLLGEAFNAFLRVELPDDKTRDIVYHKSFLNNGPPLWVFVNHWSSHYGPAAESNAKRMAAAKTLRTKIDNVWQGQANAHILALGDFNDNPTAPALTCLTGPDSSSGAPLVNLMAPLQQQGQYTLKYKDEKLVYDQLIVSESMLDNPVFYIRHQAAYIFAPEWLTYPHAKYGPIPNRTYASGKWVGGYSDHYPVYFDVVFK